ncbi:hypothetical protein LIER_03695 [Lithospermum erythrorhizon]|uniref:Uncharacterized protein n=1 Tax=Lithospermum erythrorhizon TaxID=34254 RepID=A0AAV3NY23_LITER
MTSGSNKRSPSHPERPDSPVLVMEPKTLAFCRLYIAIGAEISMGDLRFTPHHDPFANMVIPQEVAENIARYPNEASGEGSTRPTEVFFVQPSEAHNPEVAQSNPSSAPSPTPAPSPAPGVDASQTGASATQIDDLLQAAEKYVEPKDISFSSMTGERRPAFRKTKRSAPEEGQPKAFAPRKKHTTQWPKQVEQLIISEDPPAASSPPPSAPVVTMNIPSPPSLQEMPSFPSSSLLEDVADSRPKAPDTQPTS